MSELNHELLVGDASAIHASAPREQRTDKRDARRIVRLLMENRFPAIWQPSVGNEEQRQLLLHRGRLVRMRTQIKNQLVSIAKSEGLTGSRAWSAKRRQQIEALPLKGWYAERSNPIKVAVERLGRLWIARVALDACVSRKWSERALRLTFVSGLPVQTVMLAVVADELLGILPHMTVIVSLAEVFYLGIRHGVKNVHGCQFVATDPANQYLLLCRGSVEIPLPRRVFQQGEWERIVLCANVEDHPSVCQLAPAVHLIIADRE